MQARPPSKKVFLNLVHTCSYSTALIAINRKCDNENSLKIIKKGIICAEFCD